MEYFSNAIAIVTGAGSGMGRALSEALARRGAIVIAVDINANAVAVVVDSITAAGGEAFASQVDVTQADAVQRLVDETVTTHGRVDFIFNNAGIVVAGDYRDITLDHWHRILNVNVWGVIHGSHAAYPVMVRQGSGHIVNTASVAGLIPVASLLPYTTTKHAVVGFSQALRNQGRALGVRVTTICPGVIRTGLVAAGDAPNIDTQRLEAKVQRTMSAEDAARIILRGVERNRSLVVFPFGYRVVWWLSRLAPGLVQALGGPDMRALRKLRQV